MKASTGDTLTGPAGTATEVLVELEPDDRPDTGATVACWWLDCPGQTPFWQHYVLSIVHLRDFPGARPAVVVVPHATHEVLVYACDPTESPRPDDPNTWRPLHPINVAEQVQLPDDEAARGLLRQAAEAVVNGVLWAEPPLSGQVEPWRTSLIKTSAHWRGEEHSP